MAKRRKRNTNEQKLRVDDEQKEGGRFREVDKVGGDTHTSSNKFSLIDVVSVPCVQPGTCSHALCTSTDVLAINLGVTQRSPHTYRRLQQHMKCSTSLPKRDNETEPSSV